MTDASPPGATRTSARPARRGSYSKSAARRQQILDRALIVFNDLGFDGTSLRAIADAIGVTHPTLVHHFGSREQLFIEVLREYDRQCLELVLKPDDSVLDFVTKAADYSMRVPGLMALLNGMVARALEPGNDHSHEYFVARYAWVRRHVAVILEAGQATGSVRTDVAVEEAAALFIAAADGLSTQWLLDRSADMRAGLLLLERLLQPSAT